MSEQQTPEANPEIITDEQSLPEQESANSQQQQQEAEILEAPALDDWQDKYIRLAAEFENFRKRTRKEAAQSRLREREVVVLEFIEILDNLERAFEIPGAQENAWLEGMRGVHRQFVTTLTGLGVSAIEALNKPYDPRLHEALTTAPNPELANDTVIHIIQQGYMLNQETILRPAKVVVVRNE